MREVYGSTEKMKQKILTDAGDVVQTVKLPWLSLPGVQPLTPMQKPPALQLNPDTSLPVTGPKLLTLLAPAYLHWGKA